MNQKSPQTRLSRLGLSSPEELGRVGFALGFSGLVGIAMAAGPQPLSDLLAGPLSAGEHPQVIVVSMDGAQGIVDWQETADRARAIGVPVVAAVHPPAGQLNAQGLDPMLDVQDDLGLSPGWDGTHRTWRAAQGNRATFPARIRWAAGEPVSGRLQLGGDAPATLHYSHLPYLAPESLGDAIVLLGETDPWVAPMVQTAFGELPLVEVVSRAVASPEQAPANAGWVALLSALVGLFGALSVVSTRRLQMAAAGGLTALAGSASALALGSWLPVEALLSAGITGASVAGLLLWSRHHLDFVSLVDRAIWTLNVQPSRSQVEESWLELAVAAVELGVASEAYVMEGQGDAATLQAAADRRGVLRIDRLPPPFPDPLVMRLPLYAGRQGQLVMRRAPGAATELRALRTLAAHQARALGEQPERFNRDKGYLAQGVAMVEAAFDSLLQRNRGLSGAVASGVGARALFDPLGRLVQSDARIEAVIFPQGRPMNPSLVQVWTALGGAGYDVSEVLTGGSTRRLVLADGGLLALSAVLDGHRLRGMLLEYLPAQDAPAAQPSTQRASFRKR
ncbi:MAG: hypothetical protein VX899_06805 [Myxococcota bacterium]|nr:hypothetical protein [Myxococcota bacterium]